MKTILILFAFLWTAGLQGQTATEDTTVHTLVEAMPEFPGGQQELLKYLRSVPYPEEAFEKNISGTVFVKIVIEKNGTVSRFTIERSSGNTLLDSAAVAYVGKMPVWKPARQHGVPVRMFFIVPIRFGEIPPQPNVLPPLKESPPPPKKKN